MAFCIVIRHSKIIVNTTREQTVNVYITAGTLPTVAPAAAIRSKHHNYVVFSFNFFDYL
jgi:hypothetical protein